MKKNSYYCVLIIAGVDPAAGAGLFTDIKTISATGGYAVGIITALTAQNTQHIRAIQEIPSTFVRQQINTIFDDIAIRAVKIGMLYTQENIEVVASALERFKPNNVVLDPVMMATNDYELLPSTHIHFFKELLFPLVDIITPNLIEAEKIIGIKITNQSNMEFAAEQISRSFNVNVLIKGGHLSGPHCSDVLYSKEDCKFLWFHEKKIQTNNTHGTGCTLSSAIASYLAQSYGLHEAIYLAKKYLTSAIESGVSFQLGSGCGPVHHFYTSPTQ